MSAEFCPRTAGCTEYQNLLIACQKALVTWREQREEITELGSCRKEATDELLRLQADYAKAYSRSKNHKDNCEVCRCIAEVGGTKFASISMLN
jgi:hypothetical protein